MSHNESITFGRDLCLDAVYVNPQCMVESINLQATEFYC